ncbi:MAG: hypothetical protein DYG89_23375 [Caldilinea sp. CFX5]|nr:hypothetical protein [Caldilinea sp. CFX5]
MTHLWRLLPMLVLISALLQASAGPTLAGPPLFQTPAITLTATARQVQAGTPQTLQLRLTGRTTPITLFVLTVTYPNGATERTLHSVEGDERAITWTVPADAGTGTATFRISAQSCNCGNHSTIPGQAIPDGDITGAFQVIARS